MNAREQPDACAVVLVPAVRKARTAHRSLQVERTREVEEQHVTLGERGVVHHRAARHLDVHRARHSRVGADSQVADPVAPTPEVRDDVQVSGDRIPVRMRGERMLERPAEARRTDRVQLGRELDRWGARFHDRERTARVADHVGVGREVERALGEGRRRRGLTERGRDHRAAHPPVTVPLGPPVAQAHAVHHPVAREPVVDGRVLLAQRVRDRCATGDRTARAGSRP